MMSPIGPDRLFTAVRRYVSYRGETRHWAVGASTAAHDPNRTPNVPRQSNPDNDCAGAIMRLEIKVRV
jgi:hypothetical protein